MRIIAPTALATCLAVVLGCGQALGSESERPSSAGWEVLQSLANQEFRDASGTPWRVIVEGDLGRGYRVALVGPTTEAGVGTVAVTWIEDPVPARVDGDVADLYRIVRSEPHPDLHGDLSVSYRRWLEDRSDQ